MLWDLRIGSLGDLSVTSFSSSSMIRPQIIFKNIHMNLQFDRANSKRRRRAYDPVGGSQHTVTSVQWLRDERLLMTSGAVDGRVKAWDLRFPGDASEPVVSVNPAESWSKAQGSETWDMVRGRARGLSHLEVNSSGTKVLCSCLDNSTYVMDTASFHTVPIRLVGHRGNSFYVQADFSPDEQFVVSGSANHEIHFWKLRGLSHGQTANPLTTLAGHNGEVSVVRWSREFTQVMSISDDTTCRLWEIGSQQLEQSR
jgi:WD40 repeat protein